MENEIKNNKILEMIKANKFILYIISTIIVLIFLSINYFDYYQKKQNNKISEQYIKAGIYLALKDVEKSEIIYKEIILSKNHFYSLLSLNSLIENEIIKDNDEMLQLFDKVKNVQKNEEQKDLVLFKKALYLMNISKVDEGHKILKEIVSKNSLWKDISLEILN